MNRIAHRWLSSVVCLTLVAGVFAADDSHPIKKLASAEADAEIAVKEARDAVQKFDRSYDAKRDTLNRQPDMVRRIIQEVRHKEEMKPDDARSQIVFESCELSNRAVEDQWGEQQAGIRESDAAAQKIQERMNHLQESFQVARQLAEHWKQADLPLDSLSAVFATLTAEAKKLSDELPKLEGDLESRLDAWSKLAGKTKDALGAK